MTIHLRSARQRHHRARSENVARQASGLAATTRGEDAQDLRHPAEPALGMTVGDRQLSGVEPRGDDPAEVFADDTLIRSPASRNSPSQTGWTGICRIRENWVPFQG